MPVDQNEILSKAVATLRADAGLLALTGDLDPGNPGEARVYNHVPQDEKQPYVLVVWESGKEGDTKDSTGFEGRLNHEVVTTHHGDRDVLKMQDAVIAAYEAAPIVLVAGEIICFQFASGSTPVNVFSTHRATFFYNVFVDDDGVGGIPLPPVSGGSIVVQDEGVDLDETPHRKLNFIGDGVVAVDAGDGIADITIPGGGGGPDVFIMKSADEPVADSDVLQNDDELFFAVEVGEKWSILLTIYYTGQIVPSVGLKHTIDVDAGAPDVALYSTVPNVSVTAFGSSSVAGGSDAIREARVHATLDNTGGDSTVCRFKFAQDVSDARPVVVKKGSTLMAWKQ